MPAEVSVPLVLTGGTIFTGAHSDATAEALVVDGSQIGFVGSAADAVAHAGEGARLVDLGGRFVMAGFVDAHVHLVATGANLLQVQLRDANDLDEIGARLVAASLADPDAPRLVGASWRYEAVPGATPHRTMIDQFVADRPVYLLSDDLHSSWLNSAALAELGITPDTPDPRGGRIVRDDTTGEATGHLLELAHYERVTPLLEDVTADEIDEFVRAAMNVYAAAGVTTIVDMAMVEAELESLARLRDAGELTMRIAAHMLVNRADDAAGERAQVDRAAELRDLYDGDWLRVVGIKLVLDGTIDGCTAAMGSPYVNGTNGDPIWDQESLNAVVCAADAHGLQVAAHAIGDAAVAMALDAFALAAETRASDTSSAPRRHRIEHLEYADESDIARLGQLGITASMQPVHLDPTIMANWVAMIGAERANMGFAWPKYVDGGATLAFGTDSPTAPLQALPNMYLASTRRSPSDPTLEPHRPDWALPIGEALLHATREAAYAARLETLLGTLEAGKAADLVVLDRSPLGAAPEQLLETNVDVTMVSGAIVHGSL
jgi:predicted amidohydrolase YtcJ